MSSIQKRRQQLRTPYRSTSITYPKLPPLTSSMPGGLGGIRDTVEEDEQEAPPTLPAEMDDEELEFWLSNLEANGFPKSMYPHFMDAEPDIGLNQASAQACPTTEHLRHVAENKPTEFLADLCNILYQRDIGVRFAESYLLNQARAGKGTDLVTPEIEKLRQQAKRSDEHVVEMNNAFGDLQDQLEAEKLARITAEEALRRQRASSTPFTQNGSMKSSKAMPNPATFTGQALSLIHI
jgi:hypothetical protein